MSRNRFRLRKLAIALAALVAARASLSLLLLLPSLHRALRSRLEQAIGRSVEVSRFDLSVWNGLRLEVFYVTVSEDPEFGSEFLLRADRLDAAPDWRALLHGRLAMSRLWLERPSLNLVRTASGRWNYQAWIETHRWLTSDSGPILSLLPSLKGLAIHDGRINFKRGPEKLPFALLGVNGNLSASSQGRWSITLLAQPFRAGVTLQEIGSLRLVGSLPDSGLLGAGTSPADFSAQWDQASLTDAIRLLSGRDFGVRGKLEASISFRTPPPPAVTGKSGNISSPEARAPASSVRTASGWSVSGVLRVTEVHRWDLPLVSGLPALNLTVEGTASADRRRWELSSILLEAPRSNLRGRAFLDRDALQTSSLRVVTSSIRLEDLLAWYRAFRPGVDPGLALEGSLGSDVELAGWPPSVVRAAMVTTGARLRLPGERGSVFLRRAVLTADRSSARLGETSLGLSEDESGAHFSATMFWAPRLPFIARLTGGTGHLAQLSAVLAALGLSSSARPFQVAGSIILKLNASGFALPWQIETQGSAVLENARFSGGLLRSELASGRVGLDFLPGEKRIQISTLRAFGGTWNGSLRAPSFAGPWEFRLAVDRVVPALLVRGFSGEPQENSSMLSRTLPEQAAATVAREEPRWPHWLRGEGFISAGTLAVGRLELGRLNGRLSIAQRAIALENAEASVAAGRVRGEARSVFGEEPRYAVRAEFDGVQVATLAALAVPSRQCCAGAGSGRLELTASGWNRDALLASLKGTGRAQVQYATLFHLDLPASLAKGRVVPGRTPVRQVSSEFSLANGHVWLDRMDLQLPEYQLEVTGNADFHGQLDLRLSPVEAKKGSGAAPDPRLQWKGTLADPRVAQASNQSP